MRGKNSMGVASNILRQIQAKMGADLYSIQPIPSQSKLPMFVGIDSLTLGGNNVMGMSASYNEDGTKYFSQLGYSALKANQKKNREYDIEKQEEVTAASMSQNIESFIKEALEVYSKNNKRGNLPAQIFVYRDGVGGPHMRDKVVKKEVNQIVNGIKGFTKNYNPEIIYILIDKKTQCRLFS
jgi:hypothetical protein